MTDLLLNATLFILILVSGWFATRFYVKLAYHQCEHCGSLNVKRRSECRVCRHPLP
ncbi:MAG: hypothetical protein OXH92_07915 [Bryobacterales bacterium]|nr:hypothetical protein [Bryobacterales bacterium]MDE0292845.1 hypothetical protein [Bryobacterales bacterium]MDE0433921.1 hypothetical protein [Bryobacterales bacterium]